MCAVLSGFAPVSLSPLRSPSSPSKDNEDFNAEIYELMKRAFQGQALAISDVLSCRPAEEQAGEGNGLGSEISSHASPASVLVREEAQAADDAQVECQGLEQTCELERIVERQKHDLAAHVRVQETLEEENFHLKRRVEGLELRLAGLMTHVRVHERYLSALEAWQCQNNSEGDRATGARFLLDPATGATWPPSSARWTCATPGCKRERQFEPGCPADRCCKEGFLTGCQTHEPWCNKDFGE